MKKPDEIKKGNPKCPWCGHEMRFDADSAHVWFKCDGCLASSPKTEKVWINVKHNSENWAINERNARTTCMLLSAQVPKWISVEERLPEDDVDVLVYAVGNNENSCVAMTSYTHHMHGYNIEGWRSPWQYFFYERKITHWMPLPEPPKEE